MIFLVRLARVERATLCLGGRCSIQLSYNRRSNVPIYYNAIVQYFASEIIPTYRFPLANEAATPKTQVTARMRKISWMACSRSDRYAGEAEAATVEAV